MAGRVRSFTQSCGCSQSNPVIEQLTPSSSNCATINTAITSEWRKKAKRSNIAQIEYLCKYMHQHKEFAAGEYKTPQGAAQIERQWIQLQAALDELGPHRTVEQWKIVKNLILSQVGVQHGDPLGPLLFSLAIHKAISNIQSPLNVWYLDDGTVGGETDRVKQDLLTLITRLRDLGLEVNSAKCEFFPCSAGVGVVGGYLEKKSLLFYLISYSNIGEEFRNRKGYFSLNVQGVCDSKLIFMNVVARWPGSAYDATIFYNSELRAQYENGMFGNKWLLGDSAYPLKPYLLTPLLNPQTRGQQLYNEAHIRTRNVIERCFGVWIRRFPVVALTLRLSLPRANAVIIATAILFNISHKF
ncbi:hypothetical protein ABMA27_003190 [Loxostege sticticalis]|uniref:DDE Tnp4 domain-containing protein n=1 Tax=Loxostege sticticalis TaxID=481309 RepID=A0ABR3HSG7_LOXSC